MNTREQDLAFEEWLEGTHPRVARFEDFLMPVGWRADYSRQSLVELEAYVLDRWPDDVAYREEWDRDFIDGAVRYIGESMIESFGGSWFVSHDPEFIFAGRPCVRLDTGSTMPLSPLNLLSVIIDRRSGAVLSRIYDVQARRIEERKQNEPEGWAPQRKSVPGMEVIDHSASPETKEWLAGVGSRLDALNQRIAAGGEGLGFDDASVSFVERAVLEDLAAGRMTGSPDDPLRAQYATYLGEAARSRAGGDWVFVPGEINDYNPYIGQPYVRRVDERRENRSCVPYSSIMVLEEDRKTGHFIWVLKRYSRRV